MVCEVLQLFSSIIQRYKHWRMDLDEARCHHKISLTMSSKSAITRHFIGWKCFSLAFCMSRVRTHQTKRQLSKSYMLVAGNLIFTYTHTKKVVVAKRKLNLFMEINVHVISSEIRWFNSWKGVIVAWWLLLLWVDDLMALKYSWYHEYSNH